MNPESSYSLAGLLVQALFGALVALLLGHFSRQARRVYLQDWSRSWWAFSAGQLGAAYGFFVSPYQPADSLARLVATWISQIGAYWHACWLLFGVFSLALLWSPSKRGRIAILSGLAVLALVASLAYSWDPRAVGERIFVRVALRAFSIGACLAGAAVLLVGRFRGARSTGPRITAAALGLAAGHQVLLGLQAAGWFSERWTPAVLFLDVAMIGVVGMASIIWLLEEERERLVAAAYEIDRLAYFDALTGLPNRRLFLDRLRDAVERGAATGAGVGLIVLDLDDFKRINDTFGHEAGDRVLVAVSHRLGQVVREGDTLARVGGDEFALLATGISSESRAMELAERLRAALRAPILLEQRTLYLGASLGISLFPHHGEDPMGLLRKADTAMHRAKEAPRVKCVVYDEEMSVSTRERLALEHALREDELEQQLVLHYQPVVASGSGEIVGVEGLVRWNHPERGLVYPASFLPIAEASGSSEQIGRWVLAQALSDLVGWRSRYGTSWRVAVNLTARAFEAPGLVEEVQDALAKANLAPQALELEITETMALLSGGDSIASLRKLRELGVRIAVDDFGIGYSSLSYLRELPLDTLKLDASFIRELGRRAEDSRIVGAVIQLAHGLGMEVVAEGVEREEQMAILEMLSCDRMQGYLFSKPLPVAELESVIEAAARFRIVRAPSRDRRAR